MGLKIDILSFEAGLIDELVEPRTTAINHGRGCRRAENFITTPQGPAITRPPSRYIASTKAHGQARLIRVIYSESYAYECEFGHHYVRFFTNSGQIVSGSAAYEIASPYAAADLAAIAVFNDAGTLYLTHPDYPPYHLVFTGDPWAAPTWTLTAIPFTWGPFRDMNDTPVTILPSDVTGPITLTASTPTFVTGAAGHVGAKWLIGHRIGETQLVHRFTGNETYATTIAVAKGAHWRIATGSSWDGTLFIEKSYDAGVTWEIASSLSPAEDNNYDAIGDETYDDGLYRLRMGDWTSGTKCKATLTVDPHIAYGYATITSVTSTILANATVVETLAAGTATEIWAEGAWSPYRGYPRGVGLVDNRLTLVGTTADPTTQWLSHVNQYTDMRIGTTAADALMFTYTVGRGDPFLWVLGEQYKYYIGTPSAVLEIAAADPRSAISAVNKPEINRRIEFGSSAQPPVRAFSTLFLMDAAGVRPMKVQYDWQRDLLFAPPANFTCPTLTEIGIKRILFQRGQVPIVWFLRTDGELLGMTFEQLENGDEVKGWHEHYTLGEIEDIDCIPGTGGDTLWWIAKRTIDGATQRHVEKLDPLRFNRTRAADHALDAYIEWDGGAAKTISGIAVAAGTKRITVTASAHGFSNGDHIDFASVGGMTWLNGQTLTVTDKSTDSFVLKTLGGAYVDGSLLGAWTGGGSVRKVAMTFTGLGHLEGQSVYAHADGEIYASLVAAGSVTLPDYFNHVFIGLYVAAWLQPLRIVLPTPSGSTRGRQIHTNTVWLSVHRSWECQLGRDQSHLDTVPFRQSDTEIDAAPELVTGDFQVPVDVGWEADPTILIKRHLPLPLCVRAMMLDTTPGGSTGGKL